MIFIQIAFLMVVLAFVESATMIQENGSIVISKDKREDKRVGIFTVTKKGNYRYTYDADVADNCESVVLIAVGTAMKTDQYDILAKLVSADKPIVTVFFDPNPGNMVKFDRTKYSNFYKAFTADIGVMLPMVCENKSPKIIAGGHSAGGQGGLQAMMQEGVSPDGWVGLDPFQASPRKTLKAPATIIHPDLPVLSWGFERTTCMVTVAVAGRSEYELSGTTNRIFFKANNVDRKIGHCEFTDTGCYGGLIPFCPRPGDAKGVIAESIQVFAATIVEGGSIEPSGFAFDTSNNSVTIDVFVNAATIDHMPTISQSNETEGKTETETETETERKTETSTSTETSTETSTSTFTTTTTTTTITTTILHHQKLLPEKEKIDAQGLLP